MIADPTSSELILKPTATRKQPRWSDLLPELVETILRRLPLEDYFHFGLVCKPWWSAMVSVRGLSKPPPMLILKPYHHIADPIARASEAEATRFYAVCGGGKHRELSFRLNSFTSRCCSSSMGWLFMVDINDESRVHLLNPISGEKVELPALPPHVTLWGSNEVACSTPASDGDCIVALQGTMPWIGERRVYFTGLLTCRPKDGGWREIPFKSWLRSFAFHEGRLHVIDEMGMDVYDFDPYPRNIGSSVKFDGGWKRKGLAVVDGKLKLVVATCNAPARTRLVYEFVDNRWVEIRSLGDWVLLMNRFTSQAFSTKEAPTSGFRANCIYQENGDSLFVYSMEDDSFVTISLPNRAVTGPFIIASPSHWHWWQVYWFLAQSW